MMKTVVIIQARMSSSRLPGKVLFPLGETSVLGFLVNRLRQCSRVDELVVAIPDGSSDDALAKACDAMGVACHRGDEQDVLGRFHGAATKSGAEVVVRITSDCPFYDPDELDGMLESFHAWLEAGEQVDYFSNCTIKRTYPRGLDTEIFTFAALDRAFKEADQPHEREHVTPWIYADGERLTLRSHESDQDLSHHRWVLDTDADWRFIYRSFQELRALGERFRMSDVVECLDQHPELLELNACVEQKHADNNFFLDTES